MEQDMEKMLNDLFDQQQQGSFSSMLLSAAKKYENEAGKNGSMNIDRDVKSLYDGMLHIHKR